MHALASVLLAVVLSTDVAPPPTKPKPRLGRALLETAATLALGTGWYWANTDLNREDWELDWDLPSWNKKLFTREGIRFDSNAFDINAVKHPFGAAVLYQVGRENGYGPFGASVLTLGSSLLWEYVVEFKEIVSANDIVVNVAAGLGLAEPLYQLGEHFRRGRDNPARMVARAIVTPVGSLHDAFEDRGRAFATGSWTRFRLAAGPTVAHVDGEGRDEMTAGVDLSLIVPSYVGRPLDRSTTIGPGAWTRIVGQVRLGDGPAGSSFVGTRVRTQSTLWGRHTQRFTAPDSGWGRLLAIGSAFEYDTRRLPLEWDQVAAMHVIGPQIELTSYVGSWTLRAEAAAWTDFSLVQAHALGPFFRPLEEGPPFSSTVLGRGYYYGLGGTAMARLSAERRGFDVDLEARELRAWSIDGFDRDSAMEDAPAVPTDLADHRLWAKGGAAWRPWDGALGFTGTVEAVLRSGTARNLSRQTTEQTMMLGVVVDM